MVADLFHPGHVEFLRQARALGDELVVGLHSDATVASYKRPPILTADERLLMVASCRYVDEVIPDAPLAVTADLIDRHRIDLVVHGDDFGSEAMERFYRVPMDMGVFRTVPYTAGISTSEILDRVEKRLSRQRWAGGADG
jgi:cytidyltransferase-like protein